MSNWQLIPAKAVFEKHSKPWDELNKILYQQHPLLDSRFVNSLINHYGDQPILLALHYSIDNRLNNCLLLQKRKAGTWTTFLPSQAQIAPALCGDPKALEALFKALPGYPTSIELLCQDSDYSFTTAPLATFELMTHATTINIKLSGSFEDYWKHCSKNLRSNIKRYFNRVQKSNGSYNIKVHTDKAALNEALTRYGALETKSWKGAKGTAIHHNNLQGQFYSELLEVFCQTGQAEIIELYFGEQLVASRINLINQEMLIILKTTFDSDFSQYAPGRLLLYLLIEREFTLQRVNKIEFYTNATKEQISWSTGQRPIRHITLYRSKRIQQLFNLLKAVKKRLK